MKPNSFSSLLSCSATAIALAASTQTAAFAADCVININGGSATVAAADLAACQDAFNHEWTKYCQSNPDATVRYRLTIGGRDAGSGTDYCVKGQPTAFPPAQPPAPGPGPGPGQPPGQRPGQPGQPPGPRPDPGPAPTSCFPHSEVENVHFFTAEQNTCLMGFDRWDEDRRGGWGREHRRGDGRFVEFDVSPDCRFYDVCESRFYNPGPQPSDAGSTSIQIQRSSDSFSTFGGQSYKTTVQNPSSLITIAYRLVNRPQVTCLRPGQTRPGLVNARGRGTEVFTDRNCNVVTRDVRLEQSVPGYDTDTLIPQDWVESDLSQAQSTYWTDVTINAQPVDFPGAYPISGTISHTQGQPAQISAQSKYFTHSVQLVNQVPDPTNPLHGTQVFNLSSTLRPIAAPNNIFVDYDGRGTLTINDSDNAEFSQIDPNNQVTYSIAAYVNKNKNFGHDKYGNVVLRRPESVVQNAHQSSVQVNLRDALAANTGYSREIANGGTRWAIYLEITTTRSNKYVQSIPTSTLVYEITMDKNFVMHSDAIKLWTKGPDTYKP